MLRQKSKHDEKTFLLEKTQLPSAAKISIWRSQLIGIFLCSLLLVVFLQSSAHAYLGPGLGFGLSTMILVVLLSIMIALGFIVHNIYLRIFRSELQKSKRTKIDADS